MTADVATSGAQSQSGNLPVDPAYGDMRYRDTFWSERRYEDRCDRLALKAFLPPRGEALVELGAGFGRLADEYVGYDRVVLLDLSGVQLEAARERLKGDRRYEIVEGDMSALPFEDASFDTVVCVRVLHHFQDPRPAIAEMARVLRPGGVLIVEAANKRNLKAILLYLTRRQKWSPFTRGSVVATSGYFLPTRLQKTRGNGAHAETVEWSATTDFDHSPTDMRRWLAGCGLQVRATRTVSNFRVPVLTRRMPLRVLVGLERVTQPLFAFVTPGPELFFKAVRPRG